LNHQGEPNPSTSDLEADRPWRQNRKLAARIRSGWQAGKVEPQSTLDLLETLREGTEEDGPQRVVQLLNRGISPHCIYDALFAGAGELLMRQPGIVALHAVTSTNAIHYAFQTVSSDETRRMLLLQNAAFLPLFRKAMQGRGEVGQSRIDRFEPVWPEAKGPAAIAEIFRDVGSDRNQAAGKALAFLASQGRPQQLIDAARRLVFLKGTDSHDYKFSSAVLEDYYHVSPLWRDRFLAAAMFQLRGAEQDDNRLVKRTRDALKA
jgi:hypothetical protein